MNIAKTLRDHAPIVAILLVVFGAGLLAGDALARGAEAGERLPESANDTARMAQGDARRDARGGDPGHRGDRGNRGERGERGERSPGEGERWDRMGERLGLSEAQRAQIDAIRADYRERIVSHREACRTEGAPLREAMQAEIRSILTADQAQRLDAIQERMENRRDGARDGRRGPQREPGTRGERGPRGDRGGPGSRP